MNRAKMKTKLKDILRRKRLMYESMKNSDNPCIKGNDAQNGC